MYDTVINILELFQTVVRKNSLAKKVEEFKRSAIQSLPWYLIIMIDDSIGRSMRTASNFIDS